MSQASLRIASYNIRKARGLDQRRDPGRVIDAINTLDADVVALQEADLRLGRRPSALPRDLLSGHTDFAVADIAVTGESLGWHGNAVLLRRGLHAAGVTRMSLPGLEPRGAVHLRIRGAYAIDLVATHLGLRRRDRRKQQAEILKSVPSDGHLIIAGDFNEWSGDKGLEPFGRAFSLCAPGKSFHARHPFASLDRFALSEGTRLEEAGVADCAKARRASDHLPIWCDVAIAAEQASAPAATVSQ
ncbi:MAG: endonuclease/exonuclease/phosphatase family protein [Pseudomonadota bacterium]